MGRQISDDGWRTIERDAMAAIAYLSTSPDLTTILFEDRTYTFSLDFSPIIGQFEDHFKRHEKFEQTKDSSVWNYMKERSDCFIECSIDGDLSSGYDHSTSILTFILYEIFLTMSLVVPGTFNLDGAEFINIPEQRSVDGAVITHDVSVSSHLPENYHYERRKLSWLPNVEVSTQQVHSWIMRVCPRFKMLADNPAGRCVFALLYLCKGDAYCGAAAAWLFNGLEALLDCKPGENRAALVRRIGSILELDHRHIPALKRTISSLYDIRSAFVHGGLSTVHPLYDESLDMRVENQFGTLSDAMDAAITLYIAVLRKVISGGMDWPRFEEKLIS